MTDTHEAKKVRLKTAFQDILCLSPVFTTFLGLCVPAGKTELGVTRLSKKGYALLFTEPLRFAEG